MRFFKALALFSLATVRIAGSLCASNFTFGLDPAHPAPTCGGNASFVMSFTPTETADFVHATWQLMFQAGYTPSDLTSPLIWDWGSFYDAVLDPLDDTTGVFRTYYRTYFSSLGQWVRFATVSYAGSTTAGVPRTVKMSVETVCDRSAKCKAIKQGHYDFQVSFGAGEVRTASNARCYISYPGQVTPLAVGGKCAEKPNARS